MAFYLFQPQAPARFLSIAEADMFWSEAQGKPLVMKYTEDAGLGRYEPCLPLAAAKNLASAWLAQGRRSLRAGRKERAAGLAGRAMRLVRISKCVDSFGNLPRGQFQEPMSRGHVAQWCPADLVMEGGSEDGHGLLDIPPQSPYLLQFM